MTYTIGMTLIDLGSFFGGSFPSLTGSLKLAGLAPLSATSTTGPFSISFGGTASPPASSGTVLLSDPSEPGDVLRSGQVSVWPIEPATIMIVTVPLGPTAALPRFMGVGMFTFAQLSAMAPTPISIQIPDWAETAIFFA